MKLHHLGFLFFACAFLAVGLLPGSMYKTMQSVSVSENNVEIMRFDFWRYDEHAHFYEFYKANGELVEVIDKESAAGRSIEIWEKHDSGIKEAGR
jgi:hypothetical protein